MGLEADPVPGAVDEQIAEPGVAQHSASGLIDRFAGNSRCDGGAGRLLCPFEDLEPFAVDGNRLAHRVGAGAVAAVSVRHRPANIDDDWIANLDDPVRHLMMRTRAIRATRNDDEVNTHMAGRENPLGDIAADLALSAAGPQQSGNVGMDSIDRRPCIAERSNLGRILAHAEWMDDRARDDLTRAGHGGTQAQDFFGPHVVVERDGAGARKQARHETHGIVGLTPCMQCQAEDADRARLGGQHLEAGHDHDRIARGRKDKAGEPFERHGLIAGEIAQVRTGCHEQGIDACGGGCLLDCAQSGAVYGVV